MMCSIVFRDGQFYGRNCIRRQRGEDNSKAENDFMIYFLLLQAIKDGSIEAVITFDTDVSDRYMQSKETEDIYRTTEPQTHFDTRIR